jgi:hypothetical protein
MFFLDFLCKHGSFLVNCFWWQVRAQRERILMNLAQAVCTVNPAANGGTTGSPYFLVQGGTLLCDCIFVNLPAFSFCYHNHEQQERRITSFCLISWLFDKYWLHSWCVCAAWQSWSMADNVLSQCLANYSKPISVAQHEIGLKFNACRLLYIIVIW